MRDDGRRALHAGRGGHQRHPARGGAGTGDRGPGRAGRVRQPVARPVVHRQLQRLRRDAGAALPLVHPLPWFVCRKSQAAVPHLRPLGHLPADRRHLHADHADHPAGQAGLGRVRHGVGHRRRGHRGQGVLGAPLHGAVDDPVFGDGMGGGGRHQAAAGEPQHGQPGVPGRGRAVLHARDGVLPVAQIEIPPRHLAPVRAGRQHLSFLHRAVPAAEIN